MGKFSTLQNVNEADMAPRAALFTEEGTWHLQLKALRHRPKTRKGKSLVFAEWTVIDGPGKTKGGLYSCCYDITGVNEDNPGPQECARLIALLNNGEDEDPMTDTVLEYVFSEEQPYAGLEIVAETQKQKSGFIKFVPRRLVEVEQ